MSRYTVLLALWIMLGAPAKADNIISEEHGFIAVFPFDAEKLTIENALGPLVGYSALDEDNAILLQIQAHKILKFKNLLDTSTEAYKDLTKTNFESYCKSLGATQVKWSWTTMGKWPVIEYSCEVPNAIVEGQTSFRYGYHFLADDTFYKIGSHGLLKTKKLKDAAATLFMSFGLLDADTQKKMKERGVNSPQK